MPGEVYPQKLADLTRLPKPFLRKVYLDPMGHGEWEYLRAPTGGIMGSSKSREKPFRQHDFPVVVRHFEGAPAIMIGFSNTRIPISCKRAEDCARSDDARNAARP
jgi:hypothetical protein